MQQFSSESGHMEKRIIGVCLLVMLASSCGDGKKKTSGEELSAETTSSVGTVSDTVWTEREDKSMVPATADESFADFFYNFACDAKFQRSRIVFPLPCYGADKNVTIGKDEWEHDSLFCGKDTYTLLFNAETDMEWENDTAMTSVQVEWIYLEERKIKRYYFERLEGLWTLEAIDYASLPEEDGEKEDFFEFYKHFANDSIFQLSRLREPLKFVTADPDDEFQTLETTLEPGQWFAFQPSLPCDVLTNVNYGQDRRGGSDTKVVEIKGFGNGFNNTLCFERRHGLWKLVSFEDLSD